MRRFPVQRQVLILGLALGPLVAGWLAGYLSFEAPFYLGGALCLLGGYLVVAQIRETVPRRKAG